MAAEHDILSRQLVEGFDKVKAKRVGELSSTADALKGYEASKDSLAELQLLLSDSATEPELRSIAAEEIGPSTEDLEQISTKLRKSLVPTHPFARLPCLIEIRPGAGGSEAGLFAGDLVRMYQAFCKRHGLRVSLLKLDGDEVRSGSVEQALQEAVLEVESEGAYDVLRCEAGVHRVQRVPATESKGRTHTSVCSVLVLPSFPSTGADEMGESSFNDPDSDYYVDPKDVRTDVMRARGAGGQHVNTTDSAVRLTHIPTNTVVAIQDTRSQHKNREKAWQLLRAKIAQARREAREEEMAQLRASIVDVPRTGRSDKIRTYNWGQQRVTDHRSGMTMNNLDDIIAGGDSLDRIMDSVRIWLADRDLESLGADEEAAAAKAA
ncbi:hypothetical protein MMC09_004703 [Bachmanniomyces sp. S44760]|nr:hypothetical protein [Bachmanniomyces sp. S44760]